MGFRFAHGPRDLIGLASKTDTKKNELKTSLLGAAGPSDDKVGWWADRLVTGEAELRAWPLPTSQLALRRGNRHLTVGLAAAFLIFAGAVEIS
jgi:hypothetical protein